MTDITEIYNCTNNPSPIISRRFIYTTQIRKTKPEPMSYRYRLNKVAKELNVGIPTLVEYLAKKGEKVDMNPNAKIDEKQYELLVSAFQRDRETKSTADKIIIPSTETNKTDKKEESTIPQNNINQVSDNPDKSSSDKKNIEFKVIDKIDLSALNSRFSPNRKRRKKKLSYPPSNSNGQQTTTISKSSESTTISEPESKQTPSLESVGPKVITKIDLTQFDRKKTENNSLKRKKTEGKDTSIVPSDSQKEQTSITNDAHNEPNTKNNINYDIEDNVIFISYSRNDKSLVYPIVEQIEKELGIKCWIDLNGIKSGEEFEEIIIQAIDECKIVLFMLSDNSLKSKWTKREVYYAEDEGKRIIPVLVDGDKLRGWYKFHFGNVDYIDIRSKEQIEKLISNLKYWFANKFL